jgi:hypothetical protein
MQARTLALQSATLALELAVNRHKAYIFNWFLKKGS